MPVSFVRSVRPGEAAHRSTPGVPAAQVSRGSLHAFLTAFQEVVPEPHALPYEVMFPGPAGTDAVEAALQRSTTNGPSGRSRPVRRPS
ncbi:hypothetical protein GCM10010524_25370 [Streptomyces mexicanus]